MRLSWRSPPAAPHTDHGERARQIGVAGGGAARRPRPQRRRRTRSFARAGRACRRRSRVHRDATAAVTGAESRLHTIEELENSLEGHVPGTRAIVEAWQRGELHGIEGMISNLITTDERYARAMDVAFGARLSNVVTRTSEDAECAIEFLESQRSRESDVSSARHAW